MKVLIGFISFLHCTGMVCGEKREFFCAKKKKCLSFSSCDEFYRNFGLHYFCKGSNNKKDCLYSVPIVTFGTDLKTNSRTFPFTDVVEDDLDNFYMGDVVELWEEETSDNKIGDVMEYFWSLFTLNSN